MQVGTSIVSLCCKKQNLDFEKIRSFDIDPEAWKIAEVFNTDLVSDAWKFKASTQDIMDIDYIEHTYDTLKDLKLQLAPLTEMPQYYC